jgi:hypothetical protein
MLPGVPNSTCTASFADNFAGSTWDSNLYWGRPDVIPSPGGGGPDGGAFPGRFFRGASFAQWRASGGHDGASLLADPLFVDPQRGDYRLQPASPAVRLGYRRWDWTAPGAVGPD